MIAQNKNKKQINVAVNGSGTIGRAVIVEIIMTPSKGINLVAVNDKMPINEAADLLEHNFWRRCREHYAVDISKDKKEILVTTPDGRVLNFFYFEYNGKLPWSKVKTPIDIVFESSGAYSTREQLQKHIDEGGRGVLLTRRSITGHDVDKTVVFGINHDDITKDDKIISAASCTTGASIFLIQLMDKLVNFELCQTLSVHVPLNRKTNYDDGPGRSVGYASHFGVKGNVIPTECSIEFMVPRVLGDRFTGRITSSTVCVPTVGGSYMQMTFFAQNAENNKLIDADFLTKKLNAYIKTLPHDQIVSVSNGDMASAVVDCKPHSSIIDSTRIRVLKREKNTKFTFEIWHDSAWGYTSRLLDLAEVMMSQYLSD